MAEQFVTGLTDFDPETATPRMINAAESQPYFKYDYNVTNQPFKSEQDKVGPYTFNGDNFTNIIRWNLDDAPTTANTTFGMGIEITGYGSRWNFTQPWASQDIVVIYDGYCGSTCTILTEFLRMHCGVKSIAIGGRPSVGPMQAIGGVKGTEDMEFQNIYELANSRTIACRPPKRTRATRKSCGH
jgi:hypothetical protein